MTTLKMTTFEIVLLVVGLAAAFLGFQLINQVFTIEGELSWLMVIAIFNWLMLIILFISLSLSVDISKKGLIEIKNLIKILSKNKKK